MSSQTNESNRKTDLSPTLHHIWVTLEAPEVIELKRIAMDLDADGSVTFFCDVLTPRVRAAARKRGIALDMLVEDEDDEHISG
jgi:hypothetical protein